MKTVNKVQLLIGFTCFRVFKKCSPNNKLTLYLGNRDIVISNKNVGKIHGVVIVEPDFLQNRKIFGQVTLTFRYGREDEEVMGLKFCNEAIMCLAQLYPPHEKAQQEPKTALQEALLRRLGPNAHAFTMEVTRLAPPSVQLVPAKEYNGAPIGTSYDVRAYAADRADEKLHRRSTVRMSIRVLQQACDLLGPLSTAPSPLDTLPPPHGSADKPFLLSDGKVELEASLDKAIYCHGDTVVVNVAINNNSNKTVRRIKVFIVQHVDVCMFSNGKFKNVVAIINSKEECPLGPGAAVSRTYMLNPAKGATKNWIALEDSYSKSTACLASTVLCNSPEERNVFAIYVSYYVKIKLLMGPINGELSLKLPFTLMHSPNDLDTFNSVALPEPVLSSPTKPQAPTEDNPLTTANTQVTTEVDVIRELAEEADT